MDSFTLCILIQAKDQQKAGSPGYEDKFWVTLPHTEWRSLNSMTAGNSGTPNTVCYKTQNHPASHTFLYLWITSFFCFITQGMGTSSLLGKSVPWKTGHTNSLIAKRRADVANRSRDAGLTPGIAYSATSSQLFSSSFRSVRVFGEYSCVLHYKFLRDVCCT